MTKLFTSTIHSTEGKVICKNFKKESENNVVSMQYGDNLIIFPDIMRASDVDSPEELILGVIGWQFVKELSVKIVEGYTVKRYGSAFLFEGDGELFTYTPEQGEQILNHLKYRELENYSDGRQYIDH